MTPLRLRRFLDALTHTGPGYDTRDTVWARAYGEEIAALKQRAEEAKKRAEQAEAAITRVRAVAGWDLNGWSDLSPEKVLAALDGTADAEPTEPEGDTCGGCGHHTTWHRDTGTRPCHKTSCDCAAFTEHGPQRCCVCGSPEVAERGYGTRRYCWPCALKETFAEPVESTTPVPETAHRYLSTGCLHGHHAYCQGRTGQAGAKKPAACKFCAAPCRCACHTTAEETR